MSFPVSILNIRILLLLLLGRQFRNLRFGFGRKFLGLLFCFGNQFIARFLCGDLSQSTLRSSGIDHFLTLFLCGFDQLVTGFFRLIAQPIGLFLHLLGKRSAAGQFLYLLVDHVLDGLLGSLSDAERDFRRGERTTDIDVYGLEHTTCSTARLNGFVI